MSNTGDDDGKALDPEGGGTPPESRDEDRGKRSKAFDIFMMLFADEISEWIMSAGKKLFEYISNSF
jgi:hypothetical protein